ncbi:MAG: VCBS repeat-containing protein, partial [Verrucomicrobia bacterium]|nr:VCBS repeat-containing protein [Verrucomicrobiota bacterium]
LVGDLNNDKAEDVLMLSDSGATAFRITTNGAVTDATAFANLKFLSATNGVLVDYLFTGNLGLAAIGHGQDNVRFLRNLGSMYFSTNATNIGIPLDLSGCRQVVADDWNGDDLIDLVLQRDAAPPLILLKQSGGPLVATNPPPGAKPSIALVTGDFNNDLRNDLALLDAGAITVVYGGSEDPRSIPLGPDRGATGICAVDYDNDGWLDLITLGAKPQIWRNRWQQGFLETTEATGLASIGSVRELSAFDADNDGDIDMLVTRPDQSLALFKNEGGNVNQLLKVRLVGNRSNASGIGVKMEIFSGSTRLSRRVLTLPTEIGVGNLKQIDSINTRWFTLSLNTVDVKVDPTNPVRLDELVIADTSCPYVYVWDGSKFRFVTDILGAAPIGLPIAEGRYIEADADEFVWLGDEATVQPKDGRYRLSITEELREVLFLDEAKLVVVDHAPGTEVHTTDKLLPSGPFPPSQLVTLENRRPLLRAERLDGSDATGELQEIDGRKASPHRLREPQLRGLAEPHGVVLDFGPLPAGKPLVLSLTGWLRFGGGMANMAASIRPDLPFPFPILEYETGSGAWRPLNIQPGAPIGKTKTILVDLGDKLPPDAKRLRLSTAFEIHWDRIALWEKRPANDTRITHVRAGSTQLRWRGYGVLEDTPWHEPQRPMYETVQANPPWRVSPGGWATRYGSVDELVNERDNALAIINGGDELLLDFPAAEVPVKPSGHQRTFFLYSVGWEKDGDYHVAGRYSFEPLPWHGMNDQMHGKETRPAFENDGWIKKYNTRWCSPQILTRLPASSQ